MEKKINMWIQEIYAVIITIFLNSVCETAKETTDVRDRLLDSVGEGEGGMI